MSDLTLKQRTLVLICTLMLPLLAHAEESVSTMLQQADAFRLPDDSSRVQVHVLLMKGETLDKERDYTVYLKPGRKSLVLFNSAAERGQKALQLDDRFYLLLPKSRHPVRISPMQKLLGEAAVGDISNMTWKEDYQGTVVANNMLIDGYSSVQLDLQASRSGVTYARIELWLKADDFRPLLAKLYLQSGRIAKTVQYQSGKLDGREVIISMRMQDKIQKNKLTLVQYRSITAHETPEAWFNPQRLNRLNIE